MERIKTQPPLAVSRPLELQVPTSKLGSTKGHPFEFGLGSRLVQELGSSGKGSKNPMTQISTPKFVEEVVAKIMQVD